MRVGVSRGTGTGRGIKLKKRITKMRKNRREGPQEVGEESLRWQHCPEE